MGCPERGVCAGHARLTLASFHPHCPTHPPHPHHTPTPTPSPYPQPRRPPAPARPPPPHTHTSCPNPTPIPSHPHTPHPTPPFMDMHNQTALNRTHAARLPPLPHQPLTLPRDPAFMDMRAALVAFLWADGESAAAESEWEALQQSNGGLGAALYGRAAAVARVRNRWPPRATAALGAFLRLSERGSAEGYDGVFREYVFEAARTS